jgi:dTMP kinase
MVNRTTPRLSKGLLITFEGPDGSGKSSVAKGVHAHLAERGIAPLGLFREPGDTPPGRRIRQLSKSGRFEVPLEEEISLFIEDRKLDIERNLAPIIEAKGVALLDRYYHSSIAYQGARGGDPAQVRARNEAFAPRPDLIVLMQVSVDVCLARIERNRASGPDLFEQREALAKVCALFDAMEDEQILRLDGDQPLPVVQAAVNLAVDHLIAEHSG